MCPETMLGGRRHIPTFSMYLPIYIPTNTIYLHLALYLNPSLPIYLPTDAIISNLTLCLLPIYLNLKTREWNKNSKA